MIARRVMLPFCIICFVLILFQRESKLLTTSTRETIREDGIRSTFLAKNGTTDETTQFKNRRKFVSYTSSAWERLWFDNVDAWARNHSICQVLIEQQMDYVHDFMNLSCTHRYDEISAYPGSKWCKIDDAFAPVWYDTNERGMKPMVLFRRPMHLDPNTTPPFQPVRPGPDHEHIVSKFVFDDEMTGEQYVEYIEPLIAALRHPLAHCSVFPTRFSLFRGYVIPPPERPRSNKLYYFDAGASSWGSGAGGPSLTYFWDVWKRQGIEFDHAHAFEMTTTKEAFYETVPDHLKSKINYQQCAVSSDPNNHTDEQPFIPKLIKSHATKNDYVLFKLDIDSPQVEASNIDFILNDPDNVINEVAWEHHVDGNYLMLGQWGSIKTHMSLIDSYKYFLRLRQKGIRAHSWV